VVVAAPAASPAADSSLVAAVAPWVVAEVVELPKKLERLCRPTLLYPPLSLPIPHSSPRLRCMIYLTDATSGSLCYD
jgi:hypothetical protein